MEWLLPSEAARRMPSMEHGVQLLSLPVNARELIRSIPIPAEIIPPDEGPPAAVLQWYAKLNSHLLLIQLEEKFANDSSTLIAIHSPYTSPVGTTEEWQILQNLQGLPASIRLTDPVFIGSRHANPTHHVSRRDGQGIPQILYAACSLPDAEGLITSLRKQGSDSGYEISVPQADGYWCIVQYGGETAKIHGAFADRSTAIRAAIDLSISLGDNVVLHIQDFSHSAFRTECRFLSGKLI